MTNSPIPNKAHLRQQMCAQLKTIPKEIRQEAALLATEKFVLHPLFASSQQIACYYPKEEEFNVLPLIDAIHQAGKNCYLPVMTREHRQIDFFLYEKGSRLLPGPHDILEPEPRQRAGLAEIELIIIPLLAFTRSGFRLGRGGGYYDKYLSSHAGAIKAGIGYAWQEVEKLPSEPWDQRLDWVLTEKEWIKCQL